ncbi:MAG TPA: hypothetical protein VF337_00155 [Candidatus Limnocylindrales bacterium]
MRALFELIEVLGVEEVRIFPTQEAREHGWFEAWAEKTRRGADRRCIFALWSGEGSRADTPSPSLLMPVVNIPSYVGRAWKTA